MRHTFGKLFILRFLEQHFVQLIQSYNSLQYNKFVWPAHKMAECTKRFRSLNLVCLVIVFGQSRQEMADCAIMQYLGQG